MIGKVLWLTFLVWGIGMICYGGYELIEGYKEMTDDKIDLVDCFDRYGNKIIDQVCEDEGGDRIRIAMLLFVVGVISVAVSPMVKDV